MYSQQKEKDISIPTCVGREIEESVIRHIVSVSYLWVSEFEI